MQEPFRSPRLDRLRDRSIWFRIASDALVRQARCGWSEVEYAALCEIVLREARLAEGLPA